MDQDATRLEVDLGPGNIVLDGDPAASAPKKGHSSPHFPPVSIVAMSAVSVPLLRYGDS